MNGIIMHMNPKAENEILVSPFGFDGEMIANNSSHQLLAIFAMKNIWIYLGRSFISEDYY